MATGDAEDGSSIPGIYSIELGDGDYDDARRLQNEAIDVRPLCIAYAYDDLEIARAIVWGAERRLPITVRSGGHDYEGYCLSADGLTIDVSRCDRVTMREDGLCHIGPGVTLRKLYHTLFGFGGLTLPGGTCGTVAVAGLTLGGGFGYLGRLAGLMCDRLRGVVLIDACGIRHESWYDDHGDDLLWACRGGGGGGFGVVTDFLFEPVLSPQFVTTFSLRWRWEVATISELIPSFARWSSEAPRDIGASLVLTSQTRGVLHLFGLSLLSESDTIRELSRFTDLGPEHSIARVPYLEAVDAFAGSDFDSAHWKMASSFCVSVPDERSVAAIIQSLSSAPLSGLMIELDLFGGAVSDIAPNATAFPHREALMMLQYMAYWDTNGEEPVALAWIREAFSSIDPQMGGGSYRNYSDRNLINWPSRYFGQNYPRLQAIKAQFDPRNSFRYPQSIEPLKP